MSDSVLVQLMSEIDALRDRVAQLEVQENHNFSAANIGANTGAVLGEVKATTLTANKTRRIPLVPIWDARTAVAPVFVTDAHGGIGGTMHLDETDGNAAFKQIGFAEVVLPTDYVAGTAVYLKWVAQSDAAGNNYVWAVQVFSHANGGTTWTILNNINVVIAAPAVANTLQICSRTLTTNPTAGDSLYVQLGMASNHASDSNTGTRSLYSAWLEYTAQL